MKNRKNNIRIIILIISLVFTFLSFKIAKGKPEDLFPVISGWERLEKIQVYDDNTLYYYINGAADLYLLYSFKELRVAEYTRAGGKNVMVEIYNHQTPEMAYGMYSQERTPEARLISIGGQGYAEGTILNFFAGPYYVKLRNYDDSDQSEADLKTVAAAVFEKLHVKAEMPADLKLFPEKGKQRNSDAFISHDYIGLSFMNKVYEATYREEGTPVKVFIKINNSKEESKQLVSKYLEFVKTKSDTKEGLIILDDPYNGKVFIQLKDKYLVGVHGTDDEKLAQKYIELIVQNLK